MISGGLHDAVSDGCPNPDVRTEIAPKCARAGRTAPPRTGLALTHVIDTSVPTRLGRPAVRQAIQPRAERGELARVGISDLEIGYSGAERR